MLFDFIPKKRKLQQNDKQRLLFLICTYWKPNISVGQLEARIATTQN